MRKLLFLLAGILCVNQAKSQNNVGIGTNFPSSNAILHLENGASNLGLLLPNVDHLVFTPSGTDIGMMIFDDTENKVYTWDGTNWISSTSEWGLNGNDIYNLNSGNVGIGTMTPVSRLHVQNTTSVSSQRGSMMSYSNNNSNSNAIVAVGNNNGLPTGFVYSRAHLAGYGQGPATLGLVDYGVWGHVPNGTWGVLASNGADSLLPNTYAALGGINYSALLMGGNVGIGNTAPLAQLSITTASNLAIQLDGSSTVGTWLSMNNSSTGGEWFHLINTGSANGEGPGKLVIHRGTGPGTASGAIITMDHATLNVGIGNTNPWAPLHFATTTANRKIALWQAADNEHEYYGFGVNSNTLRYQVPSTVDRHVFYVGTSATSSNELMRIQGNGNVGIGTASPFSTLSVNGSITVDHGDANVGNFQTGLKFGAGNTGEVIASNRSAGVNQFGIDFYTGYANRMAILSSGNVGIGTANPLSTLEVNGSIRLSNGVPRQIIMTPEPNGNDAQSLQIKASDASSGPQARNGGSLILDGGHNYNISIAGSTPGHVFLRSGGNLFTGGNSPPGDIYFQSGGVSVAANSYTNRAIIRGSDGFMGIGLLAPSFALHVNGFVGGFSFINTSDERLKKEIEPLDNSLNKILALNGVSYKWDKSVDSEMKVDDKVHLGFLAQEVEEVLPQIVHTADDEMGTKRVEYSSIIPVLVEAMKEQQALIESLKKENENIKEQNSQFELRLNTLEVSLPSN